MFIAKDRKTGLYFKRGRVNSMWDSKLVEKKYATVFRSMSGVKNCLGSLVKLDRPKRVNRYRTQYFKMVIDEKRWEIIPVELEEKSHE